MLDHAPQAPSQFRVVVVVVVVVDEVVVVVVVVRLNVAERSSQMKACSDSCACAASLQSVYVDTAASVMYLAYCELKPG